VGGPAKDPLQTDPLQQAAVRPSVEMAITSEANEHSRPASDHTSESPSSPGSRKVGRRGTLPSTSTRQCGVASIAASGTLQKGDLTSGYSPSEH
jgi:hypothetical protein